MTERGMKQAGRKEPSGRRTTWASDPVRTYYVYIMASASRVLYTGVTNNLQRRAWEHRQKLVPGFSQRYNVCELVYFEVFGDIRAAIMREKQIKGWVRKKKIALVEAFNPRWKDLSAKWLTATSRAAAQRGLSS